MEPHEVWQALLPPGDEGPLDSLTYAAALPDGRRIVLPIRELPGREGQGVASLILNQASFAVLDALAEALTGPVRAEAPDVVVGVPTLGLPLAEGLARRLGHGRMVPLSNSRKFWYDDDLSQPIGSITTPDQEKRVWLDPRVAPLLRDRRVLLVDDVLSSGRSVRAVLRLLAAAGVRPVGIACAMLQGQGWRPVLDHEAPGVPVLAAIRTPLLECRDGHWRPQAGA